MYSSVLFMVQSSLKPLRGSGLTATSVLARTRRTCSSGMRPVNVDRILVGGQLLIIQIYCPEKLPEFQKFVDTLKFSDVVKQ